jgi:hypothetical protein
MYQIFENGDGLSVPIFRGVLLQKNLGHFVQGMDRPGDGSSKGWFFQGTLCPGDVFGFLQLL